MWFKWTEGTISDPRLYYVSRRSGQPLVAVIAIWAALLETASMATARGDVTEFIPRVFDCLFELEAGGAEAILSSMEEVGLVEDGRVARWDDLQGKRASRGAGREVTAGAARVRAYRARQRAEREQDVTPVTQDVTPRSNGGKVRGSGLCKGPSPDFFRKRLTPEGVQWEPRPPDERSIEFIELRQGYDEFKPEGECAGLREYNRLRRSPDWPGWMAVLDAARRLADEDDAWRRGYIPNLGTFLANHGWTQKPRAAPALASGGLTSAQLNATFQRQLNLLTEDRVS